MYRSRESIDSECPELTNQETICAYYLKIRKWPSEKPTNQPV